ncbi:MAG: glycosyltransferase family 39 protein [bacterium]
MNQYSRLPKQQSRISLFLIDHAHLLFIAMVSGVIHLLPLFLFPEYGYFRDEFYYIACAKRLAFGYVDHPPLAPFFLRVVLLTLGDSLLAIRILPSFSGAITVFLTGYIAHQLGAGKFGQSTAAIAMAVSPLFLGIHGFFSMNPFENLFWAACVSVIIRLIQRDNPKLWLVVGALIGIGLLNKHTFVVYAISGIAGLLLTPARRYLTGKWIWLGAGIAGIILLPNIIWQFQHHFVSLEFYQHATAFKNIDVAPLRSLFNQIMFMNPVTFPFWLAGAWYYLFSRGGKPYRLLGWIYLFVLVTLLLARSSRPDRILAVYPMLCAAGGLTIGKFVERFHMRLIFQTAIIAVLFVFGSSMVPIGVPLLPPSLAIRYFQKLGVSTQIEKGVNLSLPQWYADRFGWKKMVANIAEVYQSLPAKEKPYITILAGNYGQAGAIEFFGLQYHLPQVFSLHNNYHLWGPPDESMRTYMAIGISFKDLSSVFEDIKQVRVHTCEYCRENNLTIYVCRCPKRSIKDLWPKLKQYS